MDYRDERTKNNEMCSITYTGWGYFEVPMTIYWRKISGKKESLTIDHMLNFDGKGKWKQVTIPFDKD